MSKKPRYISTILALFFFLPISSCNNNDEEYSLIEQTCDTFDRINLQFEYPCESSISLIVNGSNPNQLVPGFTIHNVVLGRNKEIGYKSTLIWGSTYDPYYGYEVNSARAISLYLDTDNDSSTGLPINSIGADLLLTYEILPPTQQNQRLADAYQWAGGKFNSIAVNKAGQGGSVEFASAIFNLNTTILNFNNKISGNGVAVIGHYPGYDMANYQVEFYVTYDFTFSFPAQPQ